MGAIRVQTYRAAGAFTYKVPENGVYRFYVIGKGGNGSTGNKMQGTCGVNGGTGGSGGGHAVHEVELTAGDTCQIEIGIASKTKLVCKGSTIEATDGNYTTPGKGSGGNVSNVSGAYGSAGTPGDGRLSEPYIYIYGGNGGAGAPSVGKYQSVGGYGGRGGGTHWLSSGINTPIINDGHGTSGGSPVNSDTSIGGAGGGPGGGGGGLSGSENGSVGMGGLGGVVIEVINSAPTAPAYIDISEEKVLANKGAHLLWGASEDIDGNFAGYILERSEDSGIWTRIYKGSLRQYADLVVFYCNTVQYRVKAYDSQGSESGYVTTVVKNIIHNTPPTAPPSVYLSKPVFGGSKITVSWGQSTDADNNLAGYTLEQRVDSGEWTEIANTTALTAEVPITFGWKNIQFRVRAYDAYGEVGVYANSEFVTIINNRAPVISGEDSDLGTMINTFAPQKYTVTDEDGGVVTVVEKLDGVVKRTFSVVLGAENTLELVPDAWRKLLNGVHTWSVTATDALGACATRTLTFTKLVSEIRFALANPLPADAMPERFIMSFQGALPDGATLTIEVCNNYFDEVPAWEEITAKVLTGQKHFFHNTEKVAEKWGIGVQVTMERGSAVGDCYIHSHRGNYA